MTPDEQRARISAQSMQHYVDSVRGLQEVYALMAERERAAEVYRQLLDQGNSAGVTALRRALRPTLRFIRCSITPARNVALITLGGMHDTSRERIAALPCPTRSPAGQRDAA